MGYTLPNQGSPSSNPGGKSGIFGLFFPYQGVTIATLVCKSPIYNSSDLDKSERFNYVRTKGLYHESLANNWH